MASVTVESGTGGGFTLEPGVGIDLEEIASGVASIKITGVGVPTSDPGVAGAIWNNSGNLVVSTGS